MALLGSDTSVTGPFPKGVLLLETLAGTEALAAPFAYELGLLSEDANLDAKVVLGKPMAVGIKLGTGGFRYFHGIVSSFVKSGTTRLHTRYAARLVPKLSLCDYTSECRIFNDSPQDAVGIVTQVLADCDVMAVESGALTDHAFRSREICTQYQESDLHFVQRLLEEEGIYYFFHHTEEGHTMVLGDSVSAHETSPGYETVLYTPEERDKAGADEHFWSMTVRKGLYPGQHTVVAGYDATKKRPKQPQVGNERSEQPAPGRQFEHYDHPGGLSASEEAGKEAKLRQQADHVEKNVIEVEGNTMGLGVGHLVTILPDLDGGDAVVPFWKPLGFAKQYLIVRAHYSLSIDQYETGAVAGKDEGFKATYLLLDSQMPFRPRRTLRKPPMGPQTALVVGPAGEEIWPDKLGRIRIQFDWDRKGHHDEKSTCWVRSVDLWAGPGFGGQHLPRVGQEVLVRFLDGDPDRPVVTGALYNQDSMPPYELPAHATQSGWKSRSSKGGTAANFNEIRFEDQKGAEELHVQAERDMSTVVKHCQALHVGANRSIVVGNDEQNLVKASRALTVKANDSVVVNGKHDKTITGRVVQVYGGDHSRKVDGDQDLVEEQNKTEHVKQAYTLTTDKRFQLVQDATSMTFRGTNVTLNSGGEIVLTAGGAVVSVDETGMTTFDSPTGIKLVCGGSSLEITPAGIVLGGAALTAAAGGASKLGLGADAVEIKSRKVSITASGVCKVWGHKALRLQEAPVSKAKASGAGGGPGTGDAAARAKEGKKIQKGADPASPTLEIHVVDLNGKPQEGLAYEIKKPDAGTEKGKLDKDGCGKVRSTKPGEFMVTFPDLDGADWDGDGATDLPSEEARKQGSKYQVQQGDRLPTIARKKGFARWQTIWDFPANAILKNRRDANVLLPGDILAIPTKVPRVAHVAGGAAAFAVQTAPELFRVRFTDLGVPENASVRFRAEPDNGPAVEGTLENHGTMEIELPPDASQVKVTLYLADSERALASRTFAVGHLDPPDTVSGIQARLSGLGFYSGPISGKLDEATRIAISTFRLAVLNDDSDIIDPLLISRASSEYALLEK
jgi:type VI secretion system secreted protein VgrG